MINRFSTFLKLFVNLFLVVLGPCCCVRAFSVVVASEGSSALQLVGFSLWWLLLLQSTSSGCRGFSSCGSWALELRLSSKWAQLPCGIWDLSSWTRGGTCVPALAGTLLTTGPPGTSPNSLHLISKNTSSMVPDVFLEYNSHLISVC